MGITERKGREREQMKSLILETAMRLYVEEGPESVSIRRIAERIEYSPATIYLYFRDKDEIMFALCNMAFGKFNEGLSEMAAVADPLERLRVGGQAYVRFALENPEYYDLMFILRSPGKTIAEKDDWEIGMRSFDMLRDNVRDCISAGIFPEDTDVDAAAFAIWSLVHGIASLVICRRVKCLPDMDLNTMINQALEFMMARLV